MKKNILILFLFLSTTILGQSEKEDLINLNLIKYYKSINNDSLLIFSKKLQKSKDSCLIYSGKISQALALYKKNNYDDAEKSAKSIVNELVSGTKFCLLKVKIEALNRLFWIKKNQNKFNDAFNYLIQTKKLIDTIK